MNVITDIGVVSALGLDALTSLAAARAGVNRCAMLRTVNPASEEFLIGSPVFGHAMPCGLGEGFVGVAKAMVIGRAALADLLSRRPADTLGRIGLYVVLSDYFLFDATRRKTDADGSSEYAPSAVWRQATSEFVRRLGEDFPLPSTAMHRTYYGGHAGIASALRQAAADLEGGQVDTGIVGAIDSYVEPRTLRAAARARLLKTAEGSTGFLPGEAAAFFVVERAPDGSDGLRVALTGLDTKGETRHMLAEEPPTGSALASAIEQSLRSLTTSGAHVGLVVGDLNGDERRALEWGYCLARLQGRHPVVSARLWTPASSFGETGCASGSLAICVAARGLRRGYAKSSHVAIALSSEGGEKAGICLSVVGRS
jgi:3-oxoacyl-[acyl-carrier-protein] synthase-1